MSKNPTPTIVVPARLASSRFPKKLLADAGGMPLILRTANRLRNQVPEYDLVFAVDGEEIAQPLKQEGYYLYFYRSRFSFGYRSCRSGEQNFTKG